MYSTSVNYYIPRQTVVLYSGSSPRRYQTVYAKNLTIHKGIDNTLQFQFLNQDQKPVDLTGKSISCKLMSYDGSEIILQKTLSLVYPLKGIASLDVLSLETLALDATLCYYSLTIPVGVFDYPVFVDDLSGGRGVIDVVNSVFPKFMQSTELELTVHDTPTDIAPVTYYSTTYIPKHHSLLTIQVALNNYIGTIKFQGSATGLSQEWFYLDQEHSYTGYSDTDYFNIEGHFPYFRIEFASTGGTVNKILVR